MKYAIQKAGNPLQVLGLLIFWFGSTLPLLFMWARFGIWVALAGVVLFLSGALLQLRAARLTEVTADSESFEDRRPISKHFVGELTGRRTVVMFSLALGMSVAASGLLYGGGTFGPLKLAEAQRDALKALSNFVMPVSFGFAMGVLPGTYALQKTVLLTVLLAGAGGVVHWAAGRLGIQIEWSTWHGSMMLAFLSLLFMLPLMVLGLVVGRAMRHVSRVPGDL